MRLSAPTRQRKVIRMNDVMGVDIYNMSLTGNVGRCLSTSGGGLNEHIPIIIGKDDDMTISLETFHCIVDEEKTMPLKARDYKDPPVVCYGVPLNFRPENTRLYREQSTTICNGTNPGHHQGVVIAINKTKGRNNDDVW